MEKTYQSISPLKQTHHSHHKLQTKYHTQKQGQKETPKQRIYLQSAKPNNSLQRMKSYQSDSRCQSRGVPFERQIDRDSANKTVISASKQDNPHEARFESANRINSFCSKYKDPSLYPPF